MTSESPPDAGPRPEMTPETGPESLPDILPIFPLQGALLLPHGQLPLNIFEPRYRAMVEDALAGARCIGMIQPRQPEMTEPDDHPDLYDTGCVGRITSWKETADGRYLITLSGLCRFDIAAELPLHRGYRRATPDYARYLGDLETAAQPCPAAEREQLLQALRGFLDRNNLSADWDVIAKTGTDELVNVMAMICPFAPIEKQALIEAADVAERRERMVALLDMGRGIHGAESAPPPGPGATH